MTDEQKYNLIARMLDAPDSLSDAELDIIASDDELIDILAISGKLKSACSAPLDINVEAEWARFRPRLKRRTFTLSRRWMRVAAIFLGAVFISAVAVRIVDFVFIPDTEPLVADAVQSSHHEAIVPKPLEHPIAPVEEATPPQQAIPRKTKKQRAAVKEEIDIDEYVRIQQAKIDNNIATLMEEIKEKENLALQRWHDNENETVITINI